MSQISSVSSPGGITISDQSQVQSSNQGGFRSPSLGVNRSVLALTKGDKQLTKQEVADIRESFSQMFGEKITNQAFRRLDSLVKQSGDDTVRFKLGNIRVGTSFTGKDIQMAALAAMEQIAPGLKFHQQLTTCDQAISRLKNQIETLEGEIAQTKEEIGEARKEKEEYGYDVGEYGGVKFSPSAQSKIINGEEKLKELQLKLAPLKRELEEVTETREEARQSLEDFLNVLSNPTSLGEDTVTLEQRSENLESLISGTKSEISELESSIKELKTQIEDQWNEYEDIHGSRTGLALYAPAIKEKIDTLTEQLKTAQEKLDKEVESLKDLETSQVETSEQLGQLKKASSFYRTQLMLDKLGSDPRFLKCLDKVAPGKADGGALGYLQFKVGGITKESVLDKVVSVALPPVGVGRIFYKAIKAEDRERYLNVSLKQESMKQYPVARSLASALSSANEQEKWKLGISGTLSFVTTAISFKIPGYNSAFGALTSPLFTPLLDKVGEGSSHALGSLMGGVVKSGVESGLNKTKDIVSSLVELPIDMAKDSNQVSIDQQKLERALGSLQFDDGQGLPLLPIRDLGGVTQFHSLADPEIAIALLSYLGPAVDQELIGKGGVDGQSELRRQALRSEIFGAGDAEDFTAGTSTKVKQDQQLIDDLNSQGGIRPTRNELRNASPLRLLCVGSGLVTV